jgi:thiosulfate sulfurtransferase
MTFQQIDTNQVKNLIEEKDVEIVDIRDFIAYGSAHIMNARHLSDSNVQEFLTSADRSKPLVVYCYHGHTSRGAAEYFVNSGFQNVYSLDGGFEAWRAKYPVEASE